jgi:hypothetical protein
MTSKTPLVYTAMNNVSDALSVGIAKNSQNQQQRYKFRGIDDVLNHLSPQLAKNKLVITPTAKERTVTERSTKNGGILFYVTLLIDYVFTSVEDGSQHVVTVYGEAMDSADKATNKALSAAYKYAMIQAFCIPVEGMHDADSVTLEVSGRNAPDANAQSWIDAINNGQTTLQEISDEQYRNYISQYVK